MISLAYVITSACRSSLGFSPFSATAVVTAYVSFSMAPFGVIGGGSAIQISVDWDWDVEGDFVTEAVVGLATGIVLCAAADGGTLAEEAVPRLLAEIEPKRRWGGDPRSLPSYAISLDGCGKQIPPGARRGLSRSFISPGSKSRNRPSRSTNPEARDYPLPRGGRFSICTSKSLSRSISLSCRRRHSKCSSFSSCSRATDAELSMST